MQLRFEVTKNSLPGASTAIRRVIGTAFAAQRGTVLADLNRRTPVDTGELRASETVEADDRRLTLTAGTDHAIFVHQGTRSMTARPFMRDAAEAALPGIADAIASAAERELAS